jgi:hypothetical protein
MLSFDIFWLSINWHYIIPLYYSCNIVCQYAYILYLCLLIDVWSILYPMSVLDLYWIHLNTIINQIKSKAINMYVIPSFTHSYCIISWSQTNPESLERVMKGLYYQKQGWYTNYRYTQPSQQPRYVIRKLLS